MPAYSSQRRTITSTYLGSSSVSRACRPVFSQAMSVLPEPPNRSRTISWVWKSYESLAPPAQQVSLSGEDHSWGFVEEPDIALVTGSTPEMVGAFLPAVENRFVLALVIRSPKGEGILGPDQESGPLPPASRKALCRVSSSDDDIHTYTAPLQTVSMLVMAAVRNHETHRPGCRS